MKGDGEERKGQLKILHDSLPAMALVGDVITTRLMLEDLESRSGDAGGVADCVVISSKSSVWSGRGDAT